MSRQAVAGWKIAATSLAGQKHINVDGPLAGRLLAGRELQPGTPVPLAGNLMRVAEAEFAFTMARLDALYEFYYFCLVFVRAMRKVKPEYIGSCFYQFK